MDQTNVKDSPWFNIFNKHKENSLVVNNRTLRDRLRVLSTLENSLHQYRTEFHKALYSDFRKPEQETDITELYPVLHEIRYAKANLRNWLRPLQVDNPITFYGTKSKIIRVAKGNCLLISPWNYPFLLLTFGPLIGAIAGGNTIIIKPSEHTPHTSSLMKKIVKEVFNEDEVIVIEGDKNTAEQLLKLPFDHICFTGSPEVGKHVLRAASEHLASVTLELGGKTPVYIHGDTNIPDAVEKITVAKLNNAGQSCVSPDYILVAHELKETLIAALQNAFKLYYDKEDKLPGQNFASIINTENFERLEKISSNKQLQHNRESLVFEPLIIHDATIENLSMQTEIFGPVLPIISVDNEEQAIKIIHGYPAPLSIYVFAKENRIKDYFVKNTRSGSICFNDCSIQFLHPGLPFGGMGYSGIGRLHGQSGFNAFTQERVVFEQRVGFTMAKFLYPPYNNIKKKIIDLLLKFF